MLIKTICPKCEHLHASTVEGVCAWCMSGKYDMDPFGDYRTVETDEERFRDFMTKFGIDFDRPKPSSSGSCYELHDTVYFDDNGKWQKTTERDGNYDG